jgi:hypothetical protein
LEDKRESVIAAHVGREKQVGKAAEKCKKLPEESAAQSSTRLRLYRFAAALTTKPALVTTWRAAYTFASAMHGASH